VNRARTVIRTDEHRRASSGDDVRVAMEGSFATIVVTGSASLRRGDARSEHLAVLRAAISAHGGREVRPTDDGLMAAFASAVAAVRCAVELQRATGGIAIGVDAGEPLAEGDDLYGTPVIVAGRLCDVAEPGEILASSIVCQIAGPHLEEPIQPAGALRLRGLSGRVVASRVLWREGDEAAPTPLSTEQIDVVIADDQRLVRAGFRVILEDEPDIRVVGEAADGRHAVDIVLRTRPDIVLMDIRMPELDGLQAAERILSEPGVGTAVLMLTTFDRDEYVYEALRIGASGFLLKDAPADRLLDAVRVAASGEALLAPSITRRLIEQFARTARPAHDEPPVGLAELTGRELEVLRLIARGLSNAEIAAELVLSESTVKTHVAHLLSKLELRDRVQAVVMAYETGLVAPAP
jgi:DNA-binding NarL/FixJ family response regulator